MIIDFTRPLWLLLIPPIIVFIWFAAKKGKKGFRKNLICVLRASMCVLLVLAISGAGIKTYTDTTTTIFAADLSSSMDKAKNDVAEYIKEAAKHKTEKDYSGVVAFGNNSVVEIAPAKEMMLSGFNSYIEKGGTDIAKALSTASSLIDESSEKRIVVISDGNETGEAALKYVAALNSRGIKVDCAYMENALTKEVQITELNTPEVMDKNTEFDVEVVIHSLIDTNANVKVFKASDITVNRDVTLRKGENRFMFSDISKTGGGIIYRAEVSCSDDTLNENNKAYAYTYVDDVPSVLIVENDENSGREYAKLLEKSSIRVKTVSSAEAPLSLEQLNLWDSVILADVSAENLPKEFLTALEAFVKTAGGGLVATGGENSFALGGYGETVLNDLLPVSMELETEGEKPDLGMVMVIDRSGSMTTAAYGVSSMEMAKEAAMRAVEIMEPADSIGVVAFDDKPQWAVEIQKIGENSKAIVEDIGKIQPGGGTSILPALEEACKVLTTADTKLKHIILLTDGQAEQSGYDRLTQTMKANGITLSTVAVGSGSDTSLLKTLAEKGNGRYYFTNEFTDLPQIFTKETSLAGKEYINNRSFYPSARDSSPILSGINAVPQLKGYISTTAKPRADVVLQSDKEEPVLATWQYGIGRTAAWTSDSNGRWTADWLSSDQGTNIFRNVVSWVMRGGISSEVTFSGEKNGDTSKITAKMPYNGNIKKVFATILSADSTETKAEMKSDAPGVYSAEVKDLEEGGYIANLSIELSNGETQTVRGGFVISYPKEYDLRNFNGGREVLEKLSAATGGRMLESPQDVFAKTEKTAIKTRDISTLLMVLALFIFLFEIAVRRIGILSDKVEKLWKRLFIRKKKLNQPLKSEEKTLQKNEKKEKKSEEEPKTEEVKKTSTAAALVKNKKNRR